MKLSRREAIKTAAVGVGAVAAAAVLPALPAAAEPVRKYLTVLPTCPPSTDILGGFLVPKELEPSIRKCLKDGKWDYPVLPGDYDELDDETYQEYLEGVKRANEKAAFTLKPYLKTGASDNIKKAFARWVIEATR